ncbi:MAG: ATP-binding protein [Bacteroidota bacterium]
MNHFFRKLSLPAKLMLIGLVPFVFLTYLSFRLYLEKNQKVKLLGSYIERMDQSGDITQLIDNLQTERAYSFEYTLKKDMHDEILKQRPKTDSIIKRLYEYTETLADFPSYTFLKDLTNVRTAIDSGKIDLTGVMDYYTNVLFRFNALNSLPTGSSIYLRPAYKDLVGQKLLSEMITYLGIISANIYNALYTRKYMIEILFGTRGVYMFYNSYETEFLLKASPAVVQTYKNIKSTTSLQAASKYIDTAFRKFSYDSAYDYVQWEKISSSAIHELRTLQQRLLKSAQEQANVIYNHERAAKRNTLIFLILVLAFVIIIMFYTITIITNMLTELKQAAQKISKGETGLQFNIHSHDAIGSLAHSISEIDESNRRLADAATAIGNGDFSTFVKPRSDEDLLSNAIVRMKINLKQLIGDLKNAQTEIDGLNKGLEIKVTERTTQLEAVNKELEAFSYSVSHDLRAPLRVINGYATILKEDYGEKLDEEAIRITNTIISNAKMMGQLIDDLIAFSKLGASGINNQLVNMKELAGTCVDELLKQEPENKYHILIDNLPACKGDPNLLRQVWTNLIGNAIKYSSRAEKPGIEIGSKEENGTYTYFIKDNGVGFDMKYADKLFGVFQRLHTDEIYKGTGVGLALVKRIINKHMGDAWAEASPGKGATFYFSMPK